MRITILTLVLISIAGCSTAQSKELAPREQYICKSPKPTSLPDGKVINREGYDENCTPKELNNAWVIHPAVDIDTIPIDPLFYPDQWVIIGRGVGTFPLHPDGTPNAYIIQKIDLKVGETKLICHESHIPSNCESTGETGTIDSCAKIEDSHHNQLPNAIRIKRVR
jgi:hypothetical protein